MNLVEIRDKIDSIDQTLVALLRERLDLALESKQHKAQVEDLDREQEVLDNLEELSKKYHLNYDYLISIYKIIFTQGKELQNKIITR